MLRVLCFIILIQVNSGKQQFCNLFVIKLFSLVAQNNCPKEDIKFEKVIGLPPTKTTTNQLLFRLNSTESPRPITLDCIRMCQDKNDCQSFVLFYDNFECYWFDQDVTTVKDDSAVDVDAAWFVKVCLKIGKVAVILLPELNQSIL